jgi:CheY-like chemotaxis protein
MTRLWIIEDDLDFADVLWESLESDGSFQVTRVLTNKQDAEEAISTGELREVDCAPVDLQMPTRAGSEIIEPTAWLQIASEFGYKTSKAAANTGDRIFE